MAGISDIVIFGIRAGIRLGKQGRLAYIENTLNRELVLPLPNFDAEFGLGSALDYFITPAGRVHLDKDPTLKALFTKLDSSTQLDQEKQEDKDALIAAALEARIADELKDKSEEHFNEGITPDSIFALLRVHQYVKDQGNPPGLQRVLGTLIESGVDLFNQFPGIISDQTAAGRALSGFLASIDPLKLGEEHIDALTHDFFVAAVETIHTNQDLLGADDKTENLIRSVSVGLVEDVQARLQRSTAGKRTEVKKWGQLILRSVISNAGETVLSNPKSLGFDTPGGQAIVSSVGTTLLGVMLEGEVDGPDGAPVKLHSLFSRKALDAVVHASLGALAEHPELFGAKSEGLKTIITQVATGLQAPLPNRDIFPEIIRIILEKTAQNVDVLWPDRFKEGSRHLLVTASTTLLNQLALAPAEGTGWKPTFTKTQLSQLLNTVLDEVVQNPGWILESVEDGSPFLQDVLSVTLNALHRVPGNRLSKETGLLILSSIVKRVGLRRDFLKAITVNEENEAALTIILERLIDAVFSPEEDVSFQWSLARGEVFSQIVDVAMDRLATIGVTIENIERVIAAVNSAKQLLMVDGEWSLENVLRHITELTASVFTDPERLGIKHPLAQGVVRSIGHSLEQAARDNEGVNFRSLIEPASLERIVATSLDVIAENPDLFGIDNVGLQRIVTQTAGSLTPAMLKRGMLPEVLHLVLERTAQHVDLIWPERFREGSTHLLVTASALVLNQLASATEAGGPLKLTFTTSQLRGIIAAVLDEVIKNVSLILEENENPSILEQAISATLAVLQNAPEHVLSAETVRNILEAVITSVAMRPEFLERAQSLVGQISHLEDVLDRLIDLILAGDLTRIIQSTLARGDVFSKIVQAVLDRLAQAGISQASIQGIIDLIRREKEALENGGGWNLSDLIHRIKTVLF